MHQERCGRFAAPVSLLVLLSGFVRRPRSVLRAYIDETGDRGFSGKSSDFFAFAAVLVADEDEGQLRAAVSQLRRDFGVPAGRPLHWKRHVKTYSRRQHATKTLCAIDSTVVVYVGVEKAAIPTHAHMKTDQQTFYNFAAGLVVERILLAARDWPGGARDAVIRFGHVRGFNHDTTRNYLDLRARRGQPSWVPWHLRRGEIHFDDQARWDGLQAADQYAGMLNVALCSDGFGNYEPHHLVRARGRMREVKGRCWNYGFKWLGNDQTLSQMPWWPQLRMK